MWQRWKQLLAIVIKTHFIIDSLLLLSKLFQTFCWRGIRKFIIKHFVADCLEMICICFQISQAVMLTFHVSLNLLSFLFFIVYLCFIKIRIQKHRLLFADSFKHINAVFQFEVGFGSISNDLTATFLVSRFYRAVKCNWSLVNGLSRLVIIPFRCHFNSKRSLLHFLLLFVSYFLFVFRINCMGDQILIWLWNIIKFVRSQFKMSVK